MTVKLKIMRYICWCCILFQTGSAQTLLLTASKASVSQCRRDLKFFAVDADIDLVARNGSHHKILLFKDMGLVTKIAVAKSEEDALQGRYQFVIEKDIFSSPEDAKAEPKISDFATVLPGGSYATRISQQFVGTFESKRAGSFLHPGQYWIRLTIIPVPISLWTKDAVLNQTRQKWMSQGMLYSEATTTAPFKLVIKGSDNTPLCK